VIDGPERLFQLSSAFSTDFEQALRETGTLLLPDAAQAFADSFGNSGGHRFAGEIRELFDELLRVVVLDVERHPHSTILYF
jgi:hypothetical protein